MDDNMMRHGINKGEAVCVVSPCIWMVDYGYCFAGAFTTASIALASWSNPVRCFPRPASGDFFSNAPHSLFSAM